ncbi:hypothetical protein AAF712_003094 [Marasmius tenuissimus]|uniref:Uncharacterized protein n=1 Tax=Marasmius tenuissimus TaxID=585030 RepID=A0ABR3A913_9AGAR
MTFRQKSRSKPNKPPQKRGSKRKERVDSDIEVGSDDGENAVEKKKVRWGEEEEASEKTTERDTVATESEESSEIPEKVCLTVWCQNNRLGAAYYDSIKCTVYTLHDTDESAHYDLTKMSAGGPSNVADYLTDTFVVLEQVNPDVVLTSSRSDDGFIDIIRDHMDASNGLFQIRPHKDFSTSKGRDRLLSLRLLSDLPEDDSTTHTSSDVDSGVSEPRNAYDFMRRRRENVQDPMTKRWNASIRLANSVSVESSPFCMASIGALLDHLVRELSINALDDEGIRGLEVRSIEALSLFVSHFHTVEAPSPRHPSSEVMQLNADALFSLQIFENERHASVHSDKTKEGLSLAVINARHDAVTCFMKPENISTANTLKNHLKGLKNILRMLTLLRSGRARLSEWQGLIKVGEGSHISGNMH